MWQARHGHSNNEASSCHQCCGGKSSITYSQWAFVALGTQCEKRVRQIVICGLSVYTNFFSTLSHNRQDFLQNSYRNKMRVLVFSTNSDRNISHSNKNWAIYDQNVLRSSHKVSVTLVRLYIHLRTTKSHNNPIMCDFWRKSKVEYPCFPLETTKNHNNPIMCDWRKSKVE